MNKRLSILLLILSVAINSFAQLAQTLEAEIMEFAKKQHPKDKKMQRATYNLQMEGYNYLSGVTDNELLDIVEAKHPKNYNMQRLAYDQQMEGKQYMEDALDEEGKQLAISQYPKDYHMQKYVYERNLEARGYNPVVKMPKVIATKPKKAEKKPSRTAMLIKQIVQEQYPNDIAMQKEAYTKQVEAYKYMRTVTDTRIRNATYKKYPNDYVKMQIAYDRTLAARTQNTSATKSNNTSLQDRKSKIIAEIKALAQEQYPNDSEKQRFVYDKQVEAYNYMARVKNVSIKKIVQELYPTDYVEQKNAYISWVKKDRNE